MVGGKVIVAIRLAADNELPLKIGQMITFSDSGAYMLNGFKFWPDKGIVDLLFNNLPNVPKAGEIARAR
jgi:hypothetical protein